MLVGNSEPRTRVSRRPRQRPWRCWRRAVAGLVRGQPPPYNQDVTLWIAHESASDDAAGQRRRGEDRRRCAGRVADHDHRRRTTGFVMNVCPQCKAVIPPAARYCPRCGREVHAASAGGERAEPESGQAKDSYRCVACRGHFSPDTFPRYECMRCGATLCRDCRKENELCPDCQGAKGLRTLAKLALIGLVIWLIYRFGC